MNSNPQILKRNMTSENIRLSSKDGKTESWEKTIREGNMTKCIRVEKVENGYIISFNEYGRINDKAEYTDTNKKWISKTNPLEAEDTTKVKPKEKDTSINVDSKILSFIQGSSFNF